MGKLLKALQKAGLVEADQHSQNAVSDTELIAAAAASSAPHTEPPSVPTATLPPEQCDIEEQRSFESIYRAQDVPASPFPAEKMLRLLEGLKAMDLSMRTAAVRAMDAADDSWTIDDALVDAQRKIRALQDAKGRLAQQAESAQSHATDELKVRDEKHQQAVAAIRQQIADLEKLLEREVEKAAADRSEITGKARAAQDACARETRRFDTEIARLQDILDTFAASQPRTA